MMKQESLLSRYNLFWIIILCYLLPILGICMYGVSVPREISDWNIFSIGLILTACGSLVLFWLMSHWEKKLYLNLQTLKIDTESLHQDRDFVDFEEYDYIKRSLEEAQRMQERLLSEIDSLTGETQKLTIDKQNVSDQYENLQVELDRAKQMARHQLEQQQNHIRHLQEALADQKALNEKKQNQMMQLETKVGDLTYEIKTLLKFAEGHNEPTIVNVSPEQQAPIPYPESSVEPIYYLDNPVQSAQEASQQLKKCLEIAQKIKGSQRFGSQIYSFLDSPADNFSLDLRRLCDRLRGEVQSVILLYAPKDNHLLFASNQVKILSGWSPDKFAQTFFDILLDDKEWKQGINNLSMLSESQIKIKLKTKSGGILSAAGVLGMIPTGIFRNHIIAVLYTSHY
jgi:hypothetical protein